MTSQITVIALAILLAASVVVHVVAEVNHRADKRGIQARLEQAHAAAAESRARAQTLQEEIEKLHRAAAARQAELAAALAKNPAWADQELPAGIAAAINRK